MTDIQLSNAKIMLIWAESDMRKAREKMSVYETGSKSHLKTSYASSISNFYQYSANIAILRSAIKSELIARKSKGKELFVHPAIPMFDTVEVAGETPQPIKRREPKSVEHKPWEDQPRAIKI
jgi:hypothetical protein